MRKPTEKELEFYMKLISISITEDGVFAMLKKKDKENLTLAEAEALGIRFKKDEKEHREFILEDIKWSVRFIVDEDLEIKRLKTFHYFSPLQERKILLYKDDSQYSEIKAELQIKIDYPQEIELKILIPSEEMIKSILSAEILKLKEEDIYLSIPMKATSIYSDLKDLELTIISPYPENIIIWKTEWRRDE
ncbi:MAG: hypothetical protein ACTSRP_01815 [Candidatus Helarchaeota archaeon]